MTQCPTCKLLMESHSTSELTECCMRQLGEISEENTENLCPNCKYEIKDHSNQELAECMLAYLKSGSPE